MLQTQWAAGSTLQGLLQLIIPIQPEMSTGLTDFQESLQSLYLLLSNLQSLQSLRNDQSQRDGMALMLLELVASLSGLTLAP